MPTFDNLQDAQNITSAAWEAIYRRRAMSHINGESVEVGWQPDPERRVVNSWVYKHWMFTGDQEALGAWWERFGRGYVFLPAKPKDRGGWAVNLQYFPENPYQLPFNFHIGVPGEPGEEGF